MSLTLLADGIVLSFKLFRAHSGYIRMRLDIQFHDVTFGNVLWLQQKGRIGGGGCT